ncbi:sporulation integral membrane protein YtvI [Bacillus shivajii]|uniref:sporulation integral membrane protein YtvI n=1 Tax=Bacillus shivajii TaxID=1983719 RepID=UPI001CFC2BC0|nr:sporulation integral membrane protein YtvI [Bacillus shivajii]UCZ54015.1 sporulation integral membrane protein YtvI [Bacillus shivajii]
MTKNHGLIAARFVLVVILSIGSLWLLGWLFTISYPFWIAAGLLWMFMPLIRILKNKVKFPNGLAVLTALLIGLSTLAGVFTGLTFLAIFGVRRISEFVPMWIEQGSMRLQQFFNQTILPLWHELSGIMDALTPEQQSTLQEGIQELGGQVAALLGELGQKMVDALTNLLIAVPTFLIAFLFIFLAFYFLGKDWDRIVDSGIKISPAPLIRKGRAFRKMFSHRVLGFLRAQIILMGIASLIVLVGLSILRIEQALTIAIIVGVAEILPYLGSGTILIPWFIYLFITGDISLGIGIAIVYGVTIGIRQIIEPKVLSSSMNLNALGVLISLFVGFQLFGIIGLFIGPFVLVIVVIMKDIGMLKDIGYFIRYGFVDEETK